MKYIAFASLSCALIIACSAQANTRHQAPPSEVLELYDIATAPSPARIQSDIQTLVDFGTRHTLSETESDTRGIGAARRWIFAEFEKISAECGGCLEVIYVSDTISGKDRIPDPTEVVSVLAIQRGTLDPNRFVMMSGDIDSRISDPLNGNDDSPGAMTMRPAWQELSKQRAYYLNENSPDRLFMPDFRAKNRASLAAKSWPNMPLIMAGISKQFSTMT